jgi:hypothetical protein
MQIKIGIDCCNCGDTTIKTCEIHGTEIVHISLFENESFYCKTCGQTSYIGDVPIFSEDEI